MISARTVPVVFLLATLACAEEPTVDLAAERMSLELTDRAWAAAALDGSNTEAILAFWTDDAVLYPPGAPVVRGKAALREFVGGMSAIPGFSITWETEEVVVALGGQMGYTTGVNTMTAPGPNGELETTQARYITVWEKQPDGTWQCVLDMFNAGPTDGP